MFSMKTPPPQKIENERDDLPPTPDGPSGYYHITWKRLCSQCLTRFSCSEGYKKIREGSKKKILAEKNMSKNLSTGILLFEFKLKFWEGGSNQATLPPEFGHD